MEISTGDLQAKNQNYIQPFMLRVPLKKLHL